MAQRPSRPRSRHDFNIAIICALDKESDAVLALFDGKWKDHGGEFENSLHDTNIYTTGWIGNHNIVLAYLPSMGKLGAAALSTDIRRSFHNIELGLLVGICGGVPTVKQKEVILGDVVVSTGVVQFDFGRQYPRSFKRKLTVEDNLGRSLPHIRSFIHKLFTRNVHNTLEMSVLRYSTQISSCERFESFKYPGAEYDMLYESGYRHKHQIPSACKVCASCTTVDDQVCDISHQLSCTDLGCENSRLVRRERLEGYLDSRNSEIPKPLVHFGTFASGDMVMKSGLHRDEISSQDNVIAFEMEAAGLWEHIPTIVIKGICDYADSHKNKKWQEYAAANAAGCMKAVIHEWPEKETHPSGTILPISGEFMDATELEHGSSITIRSSIHHWEDCDELKESDISLSFIPHTMPYRSWVSQRGILLYQKPPTRLGEGTLGNVTAKLIAYSVKYVLTYDAAPYLQPVILYYRYPLRSTVSEAERDGPPAVIREMIVQFISSTRISSSSRHAITQGLAGRWNIKYKSLLEDLVLYQYEDLLEILWDMVKKAGNPLIIGVDNMEIITSDKKHAKELKDEHRTQLVMFIHETILRFPTTYIIISDTGDIRSIMRMSTSASVIFPVRWNTEWKECLETLDFDRRTDRRDEILPALPGTTDWFWAHPTYCGWRDRRSGILWIQGKPGSGKSVLAKSILDPSSYINDQKYSQNPPKTLQDETGLTICEWYYSTRGSSELMAHISLLRSLLYQLLHKNPQLFQYFSTHYRQFSPGLSDWISFESLKNIFVSIAASGTEALFLVDAMDESEDAATAIRRKHILAFFTAVVSKNEDSNMKFLVLSRPENDIERFFILHQRNYDDLGVIRLDEANESAIEIIVKAGIDSLRRSMRPLEHSDDEDQDNETMIKLDQKRTKRRKLTKTKSAHKHFKRSKYHRHDDDEELKKIEDFLISNAEGIILWITVIIATVKSFINGRFYKWSKVREILTGLPTDLKELFQRIVDDLTRRLDKEQLIESRDILMWVSGANSLRPIRVVELHEALSIPEKGSEFDDSIVKYDWKDFRYRLRHYCGPFVDFLRPASRKNPPGISQGSGDTGNIITRFDFVQLLHRTVKDFLSDPMCAKSLCFNDRDATTQVSRGIGQYQEILHFYENQSPTTENIKNLLRQTVDFLDDRGFLLFIIDLPKELSFPGETLFNMFILKNIGLSNLGESNSMKPLINTGKQLEAEIPYKSWRRESFFRSWDEEESDPIAVICSELIYKACYTGCDTAAELLLKIFTVYVGRLEDSALFYGQIIHALLLVAVRNGITDLSRVLVNMSRSTEWNNPENAEWKPHRLWALRIYPEIKNGLFSTLELEAARTGNTKLLQLIHTETSEIHNQIFPKPRDLKDVSRKDAIEHLMYIAKEYQSSESEEEGLEEGEEHDGDSGIRTAIKLGIDHIKQIMPGFTSTRRVFEALCLKKDTIDRAFGLYYGSNENSVYSLVQRRKRLLKKYGRLWIKRTPRLYISREGLYGLVTLAIEAKRRKQVTIGISFSQSLDKSQHEIMDWLRAPVAREIIPVIHVDRNVT